MIVFRTRSSVRSASRLSGVRGRRRPSPISPRRLSARFRGIGLASRNSAAWSGARSCSYHWMSASSFSSQARCRAAHSTGTTLAVTEMQPSPPARRNAAWLASSPDSSRNCIAQPAAQARHPRDVARGVLETDDARQLGEPPDRHVVQGAGGARGHVVEDDGKADRVVDGAEMHHHAGLGRLEIRRRDAEQRRGAGAFRRARQLDRRGRVVAAGAGDHRHAPGGRRDRPRHDAMMLVGRQQRRLAGRAARHEGGYAAIDQAIAESLQGVEVDLAQGVRRRQGGARTAAALDELAHGLPPRRPAPRAAARPAPAGARRDRTTRPRGRPPRRGRARRPGRCASGRPRPPATTRPRAPARQRAARRASSSSCSPSTSTIQARSAASQSGAGAPGRRLRTQSQPRRNSPRTNGRVWCPMTATWAGGGRWAIAITRSTSAALEASSDTALDGGSTSAASAFSWYMIGPSKIRTKT